ncbi:MAG: zinc-dependent alcohol dehydrogenase [Planctomycetota bacterium]
MAKTMKAQVFYEREKMVLEDIPVPEIGPERVLVSVKFCGICGSDVAYFFGNSSLETETGKGPLVLGHEFSGEVVQVGEIPERAGLFKPGDRPERAGLFKPGDRVVLDPVQYCNACKICKKGKVNLCETKQVLGVSVNGGFAQYCVSSYTGLHKIPEGVTYEEAAMTEPLACATHAVKRMAIEPGDFCLVIGPGTIGIMMVQLIKRCGAGKVVLVGRGGNDYRLEIGLKAGADEVLNISDSKSPYYVKNLKARITELSDGQLADAVIIPTGSVEAMESAFELSGRKARIVFFGLPADDAIVRVPAAQTIFNDKTVHFSWLAPLMWPTALDAIGRGLVDVKSLASSIIPLEELEQGLRDVKARAGNPMKVLVQPPKL